MLQTEQLTHEKLIASGELAHQKVLSREWSLASARVFLRTNCLNEKLTAHTIGRARNSAVLAQAMADADQAAVDAMHQLMEEDDSM